MPIKRGAVSDTELQRVYPSPCGTRHFTRRLNPIEADKKFGKLETDMEDSIELVRARYAKKFLKYFRKLVKQHNYSRHEITIRAAMGQPTVDVDGVWVDNKPPHGAYLLLQEISQSLSWDWATYLDGERLN